MPSISYNQMFHTAGPFEWFRCPGQLEHRSWHGVRAGEEMSTVPILGFMQSPVRSVRLPSESVGEVDAASVCVGHASSSKRVSRARSMASSVVNQKVGVGPRSLSQR